MLMRLRALWKARDGLAAVEFAFLAPVMMLFFFGTVELSAALDCRARVANLASTAADLVAQEPVVSTTDMNNIFAALNAIIYPYPTSGARIVITSLTYSTATTGKVAWSNASAGATARTTGATVTVPTGLMTTGGSVILAEVTYNYSSASTQFLTGTVAMSNLFYSRPRRSAVVTHT